MDDEERAKDSSLISGLNVMLKGAVEHQAEADDKNDSIKNGSMKDHAASQAVQGEQSSLTSVTAKSGRGGNFFNLLLSKSLDSLFLIISNPICHLLMDLIRQDLILWIFVTWSGEANDISTYIGFKMDAQGCEYWSRIRA